MPSQRILRGLEIYLTPGMRWAQRSGTSNLGHGQPCSFHPIENFLPGSSEPPCKKSDTLRLSCWRVDILVESFGRALSSSSLPRYPLGPSRLPRSPSITVSVHTSRNRSITEVSPARTPASQNPEPVIKRWWF